jgi:carboxyl-terminal processing protease
LILASRRLSFRAALALAFAAVPSAALASDETLAVFDACWKQLRALPRARARDDIEWGELKSEYRRRADDSEPGDELREVLNEMLGEVGVSHTAVLDRATYRTMMNEIAGKPSLTFGLLLEETLPGRLFVRSMYERGPAERAGLLLGDEIVAIEGEPPLESDLVVDAGYDPRPGSTRLFALRPDADVAYRLDVRSERAGPSRRATILPLETSGLESGKRSVRIVRRGAARIGIVHLWLVSRGSSRLVWDAVGGALAGCDALVLDLRGRGGLADEIDPILAPFRRGQGRRSHVAGAPKWSKPVVFLIDDRTRSAKELIAWHVRNEELGPLVGEKTEGAVLGAHFVPLPGGNWMELGAQEVPVDDGLSLEGVGVEPTRPVARALPWARGVDPILEKGLEIAAASKRRRGPY